MTASRGIARAGLIVTTAFLISRVLGSVRLIVIGATFGAGPDLDAFLAAFRIPDFIFQLVAAGALSSALIPVVAGLLATNQEARAWRVASTVATLMLAVLLVLAVIVAITAPALVPLITSHFTPDQIQRTIELTRVMLLSPILLAGGALATSLLNARGRFAASAIAPIVYNVAIILAAVFLAPPLGIVGLAIGVVIGAAGHLGIQLLPLRQTGFRFSPNVDLSDADARQALLLMAPRAIGLAASQLTFLVATSVSTGLGVGAVTAFTFAFSIFQLPIGVIGIPLGVVTLPALSRELALGETERFLALVRRALRLILFVMLPLTGFSIIARGEVVRILFGYGKMDEVSIERTATTLLWLLLALTSESMIAILARAFYAGRDTRTPVAAAIVAVAINVSLSIALAGPLGLAGIGLAITVGSWAEASVLIVVLAHRMPTFGPASLVRAGAIALGAGLVATGAAFVVVQGVAAIVGSAPGKIELIVELGVVAVVGGLVYAGIAYLLRIPELGTILDLAIAVVRRRTISA
ncbi:MAG TPA: murein biosynthesis integral membrane protein MurJ [Candidatus Limnocylindrales bacterium]|nr:murein biosynthesis integral membrane protein MurJ [Candidatus Limnocylindrales bacterium]